MAPAQDHSEQIKFAGPPAQGVLDLETGSLQLVHAVYSLISGAAQGGLCAEMPPPGDPRAIPGRSPDSAGRPRVPLGPIFYRFYEVPKEN